MTTGNIGENLLRQGFRSFFQTPNQTERNTEMDNIQTQAQVAAVVAPAIPSIQSPEAQELDFTKFNREKEYSHVVGYNPKIGEMIGFRHAVIRYRVTGTNKVDKPAKMATVPQIVLDADNYLLPQAAATVLLGVLEDQQDGMIRDFIESGKNTIQWSEITLEKTLAALTATRISNRLTREMVELWCDAAIRPFTDARAQSIVETKAASGIVIDLAKQQAASFNAYKDNLAKLAAAVPNVGQDTANSLQAFLIGSKLDDDISKVLLKKLHAILNPAVASSDL